jgi:hypothetical protein
LNGLKLATNVRRGEIPTQKASGVVGNSFVGNVSSPSKTYVNAKSPPREIMSSPRSPNTTTKITNYTASTSSVNETTTNGLRVITKGGIRFDSNLISRKVGTNTYNGTRENMKSQDRFSSPLKTVTTGYTGAALVNKTLPKGQFSPVPPHKDGSPRKTNPKTYQQMDGLRIEAGGTTIDVRGSGNSPLGKGSQSYTHTSI